LIYNKKGNENGQGIQKRSSRRNWERMFMGDYWDNFNDRVSVLLRDFGQFILLGIERVVLLILLVLYFIVIIVVAMIDWFQGRYA
jgi:hypothetical protein